MNLDYVPHPMAPQTPPAGPSAMTADDPEPAEPPVEAAPPRPRLWLRSLTSRLVAGVVALVVVIVTAVAGTTYYALSSFLSDRLDQQVLSAADPSGSSGIGSGTRNGSQPVWSAVLLPSGQYLPNLTELGTQPMKLSAAQYLQLVQSAARSLQTVTTQDGRELRVASTGLTRLEIFNGRGQPPTELTGIVLVGMSTREEDRTLRHLVFLEVIIGFSAITLAYIVTSWGVRRGLRNLYQVTGTAQEVAAELSPEGTGLDRRVPVTEPGTEVGQLAESMNTLLAAVETQFAARLESEQRMRQFLADASHELRTPLTSIRGYAELARMQRAAGNADADNLDRIESEGTRMSRLVDDLLLLARGDNDQIRVNPLELVDVGDLLDDAVAGSRAAYPDRSIDMELTSTPPVLGDRDQLLRVVRNLITNAAVHTEAARPILVRGFADQFGGRPGAVITVADGGPGLPPEQAAHVFERFWRADKARTRARGGTGLGLSIVAAIVAAHGGTVHFDSSVESGSTVTLWLPAAVE